MSFEKAVEVGIEGLETDVTMRSACFLLIMQPKHSKIIFHPVGQRHWIVCIYIPHVPGNGMFSRLLTAVGF